MTALSKDGIIHSSEVACFCVAQYRAGLVVERQLGIGFLPLSSEKRIIQPQQDTSPIERIAVFGLSSSLNTF